MKIFLLHIVLLIFCHNLSFGQKDTTLLSQKNTHEIQLELVGQTQGIGGVYYRFTKFKKNKYLVIGNGIHHYFHYYNYKAFSINHYLNFGLKLNKHFLEAGIGANSMINLRGQKSSKKDREQYYEENVIGSNPFNDRYDFQYDFHFNYYYTLKKVKIGFSVNSVNGYFSSHIRKFAFLYGINILFKI